jgi:hypothetical protein
MIETREAAVLSGLFAQVPDRVLEQFSGAPVIDANIVGTVQGAAAIADLVARWPGLFNLADPAEIRLRRSAASASHSMTEAQVVVPDGAGTAVLPIAIMGVIDEADPARRLERAHIYFYERVLNGSTGVRTSAYDHTAAAPMTKEQLGGANAAYFDALMRWDLDGVIALFSDDATIEIGTSVLPTDQIPVMYRHFLGNRTVLFFDSQIDTPEAFVIEWTSGHRVPPASGLGIYEFNERGEIRSIRMYDHVDPADFGDVEYVPIQLAAD